MVNRQEQDNRNSRQGSDPNNPGFVFGYPEPDKTDVAPPGPPEGGWLPCPCCGHQMFGEFHMYEICSVCFWEEEPLQLRYPTAPWGPNHGLSLIECQANYQRYGACREDMLKHVRPPNPDEPLDPGWRPLDPMRDAFETATGDTPMPDDLTTLYWWRPTYWRRHHTPSRNSTTDA
ncbi:CPCC family cysteine-rich protein [Streptodolium elevatio]